MIDTPLSVLELASLRSGASASEALNYTTELAQHAERWGYRRFWVAEHHNMPAIASSAPAVLIAHLAARTSTIRVGSGGVMLPNHSPLVVAEQFGMLESLHPGRIDLGVGRAPGTDQRTAIALRRTADGLSAEHFPEEFADVIRMLAGDPSRLMATPVAETLPQVWLLGSSGFSAQLAGALGLPFTFAHHFSGGNTDAAVELYRNSFRPSQWLDAPYLMISANVSCADTTERAEALARPGWISFLRLRSGSPIALPTVQEAVRYEFSAAEAEFVQSRREGQAIGDPDEVEAQLSALADRTGADELLLTNQIYDLEDRLRSYELVSQRTAHRVPASA